MNNENTPYWYEEKYPNTKSPHERDSWDTSNVKTIQQAEDEITYLLDPIGMPVAFQGEAYISERISSLEKTISELKEQNILI